MLFERVYDEGLAQASYFVGCQASGEALVVDPRRDIGVYLELAERRGMRIVAVTETHVHADYLSGSRELAAATGATLYLSGEGVEGWRYAFEGVRIFDGDIMYVGNIAVEAVHTPGHTPEHMSFLVTDGARTSQPGYFLTGDFVFVGDVGRPDLLDESAGGEDTRFAGARSMFGSLRERFLTLPDYVQIWPGHGSGSACGKSLGAVPSSTVGYEKATSWWHGFVADGNEEGFVEALLEGQPDAPSYFGRMKRQNVGGPRVLGALASPTRYSSREVEAGIGLGSVVLLDSRPYREHLAGEIPGAVYVPDGSNYASFAAWVVDPETDPPVVVVAADKRDASRKRDALVGVGIDIVGYVADPDWFDKSPVEICPADSLREAGETFVLDVRSGAELATGRIPGSTRIHGGKVLENLALLPEKDERIVTYCQSGVRSAVVASGLRRAGYKRVFELSEGFPGWVEARKEVARV